MAVSRYRVAIVGGAGMWGRHYLRVFAEHPDCEVVGLVDQARERRQEFAARYNVQAQYDTVEELLSHTVPDIVAAVVPVSQNYPVVKACAEAGVRVVSCEKPISAVLSEADAMVELCRERGTLLGCGQAAWATPHMPQVIQWVHAGNIGRLTGAAIPGGLPVEVSGAGCVQLAVLRLLTQQEAAWVEGWELPMVTGYVAPDTPPLQADVPVYGRIGLSGDIVCEVPQPGDEAHPATLVAVTGENGRVWLARPRPVLIQGTGARSGPVFPEFLDEQPDDFFSGSILRLLKALDTGEEPLSSGDDYRKALETAIAFKLSAADGHRRVSLPLPDRSHRLLPHPYRLYGGDVAGWQSIGYPGPPRVPLDLNAVAEFDELTSVSYQDIRRLFKAVEPADLALALLDAPKIMRKRAVMGLPAGLKAAVQEQMEALSQATPEEIEKAKDRIVALARRL